MIKCDNCLKDCNHYYLFNNNALCKECFEDKWVQLDKEVDSLKHECKELYSDFCSEFYFNKEKLEFISDRFNKRTKSLEQLIQTFRTFNNANYLSKHKFLEYRQQSPKQTELKNIWKAEAEEDRKPRQQSAKTTTQKFLTVQDADNFKKEIERKFNGKK